MTSDSQLEATVNQVRVDFIKTDAGCGLAFAEIAVRASNSSEKRSRNQAHARKAYDTVACWRHRLRLSESDAGWLDKKLAELRAILESIGERF